jgi:hypothetical protein
VGTRMRPTRRAAAGVRERSSTGGRSQIRFRGLIMVAARGSIGVGCVLFVRSKLLRWGASDKEIRQSLPGDDLLDHPDITATRAITVRRRTAEVWPWIAQLGQGRGGFYSYDALENLVGCDIHSARRVIPEWQEVRAGDAVQLHRDVPLTVAVAEPGIALVLRGGISMGRVPPPYDFTWTFALREMPGGLTRLLVRERYRYTRSWAALLVEPIEVISFLMSQKMLRGIRDRAESSMSG